MAMTKETKKSRRRYHFLTALSVLLFIGPIAYFGITALASGSVAVVEKLAFSGTLIAAGILTLISLINHTAYRSKTFLVLVGLAVCLNNIMVPLVVIGSCQIVEELIVSPLRSTAKTRFITNKELDKRL